MGMAVLGAFLVYGTLEPGAMVAQQSESSARQLRGELGHLPAAARLHPVPDRGHRRDQADAVRHPRGRAGDHRLLRRVLGPALRHVLPGRVPGDRHLERAHGHACSSAAGTGRRLRRLRCRRTCPTSLFVLLMFGLWTVKVFVFCAFQLLIRWSLPRFRSDQLMRLGWQRLLPISIANVVVTALVDPAGRNGARGTTWPSESKSSPVPGSLAQQMYLPAIAEGLGVTFRHFVKNFFGNVTGLRDKTDIATIEYPEEKKPYPERHRGLHRLMLRDDGQVRCVACMMCPTVCPAHCITIVPEEAPDGTHREAPQDLRDRRASLRGLRAVRRGLPLRRHPHGHPGARQADLPPRGRDPRQGRADVARHASRPPCRAAWGRSGAKRSRRAADAARRRGGARGPARRSRRAQGRSLSTRRHFGGRPRHVPRIQSP